MLLLLGSPLFLVAQNELSESSCKEKFLVFYNYVNGKAKTYDADKAFDAWLICYQNCPKYSKHIYSYGNYVFKDLFLGKAERSVQELDSLAEKMFYDWVTIYPENAAKIYDYWATSYLHRRKDKNRIYEKLDRSYSINPLSLSVKHIYPYFKYRISKDKRLNASLNIYQEMLGMINFRIDSLSRQLDAFEKKKVQGLQLTKKDFIKRNNATVKLKGLGKALVNMDDELNNLYTLDCQTLAQFYSNEFARNKKNKYWIENALSRLFLRDCGGEVVSNLIAAQAAVNLITPEALLLYHQASTEFTPFLESELKKLIDLSNDAYSKAEIYYKMALSQKNKNLPLSRQFALKALEERPSLGKAYILIATLYARSANKCGTDEFSKRLVFIAAADMAKKAKEVDPSMSYRASKYIKSYLASAPDMRFIHLPAGKSLKIGCWINETVKIP